MRTWLWRVKKMDCRDGVLGYQGTAPCVETGRMWRKVGHFRQREQEVQRPQSRTLLAIFEIKQGG